MADGTNLAGVIGTWVSVSLALIALFGIVTPILLMRRARDERRIALSKIDDESNEIVHPGIKIPFLPAIRRTIHVPNLQAPPQLASKVRRRHNRPLNRAPSVTSWVMFARTLKAYNITQPATGTLKIYQSQSWLPVHRLWIFTFGLLGRYGYRPDKGRLRSAPAAGRIDQRNLESIDPKALYGITGVLRYRASEYSRDTEQGFGQIYFSSHDKETRGSLKRDSVPFAVLFWLCMGCVPLPDGRVFDVSREPHGREHATVMEPEGQQTILQWYRFQRIEKPSPNSRILSWAQTLLGELPELWSLCMYTDTAPEERVDIEPVPGNTDTEGVSSAWIKIDRFDSERYIELKRYFKESALLWRTDVQCLAFGILKMRWSSRGCLFDIHRGHFCRVLLCSGSGSFSTLLRASRDICGTSNSSTVDRIKLIGLVDKVLPWIPSPPHRGTSDLTLSTFSRTLHEILYDFEKTLNRVYKPGVDSMAIGVIFITSPIFQKFVSDTLKEGRDTHSNILTIDPSSKYLTITAPGAYKDMRFALDFHAVFHPTVLPDTVSLSLEKVLSAALRACVRSVVFQSWSFDSADLLDCVQDMEEVVHVAAVPNAPTKAPDRLPPRKSQQRRTR